MINNNFNQTIYNTKSRAMKALFEFVEDTYRHFNTPDTIEDIDNEMLESLLAINKKAKVYGSLMCEAIKSNDDELFKLYKNTKDSLYNQKHNMLKNLIVEFNMKPVGYHTKSRMGNIAYLKLYIINGYEYHLPTTKDDIERHNICFLGKLNENRVSNINNENNMSILAENM